MSLNTVVCLASFTKLFTSVAAMQCVERGLIGLGEDVGRILPQYAQPQLLSGWSDSGDPILVDSDKITLR